MTINDIKLNKVNTINQYRVLQYLKVNLDIYKFKVVLYDADTIKIIDINNDVAYFKYDNNSSKVLFLENIL